MGYMHIDNLYKDQTILIFKECFAMEVLKQPASIIPLMFLIHDKHWERLDQSIWKMVKPERRIPTTALEC